MIIYGSSLSPFVRKVIAFGAEKQVAIDLKPIAMSDPDPAFRAASPFGKMPAMDDNGFRLADSSAICHYLDAKHPEPRLIPETPRERGRTIWFEEFADTLMFDCIRAMFFNRVVAPRFLGREGDLAAADTAEREALPRLLDYLEGEAPAAGFLVGDSLTLADIAIASPFANLEYSGVGVDAQRHPRLTAYVARILARPSFANSIERERAFIRRAAAAAA